MINFKISNKPAVTQTEMNDIYQKIITPTKIGPVMKMDDYYTDSPTVFYYDGSYYMLFIAISKDHSKSGYETHIAKSSDLINWEYSGTVLRRNDDNHWDSRQCAGYVAFKNADYYGDNTISRIDGRYYFSYLAGNSDGYEPDPLFMGLAYAADPTDPETAVRFEKPILTPYDKDSRQYEEVTLYKSCLFKDPLLTTGFPYVNVYNAKGNDNKERIFLAVSNDGTGWERYGEHACLDIISGDPDGLITGDPQIVLIGDIYVMFFFRYRKNETAYDTFACSRDLEHWTVWNGEPLVKSEYEWEQTHAHKPWFIHSNGINYHFYCAVNTAADERFIALAIS